MTLCRLVTLSILILKLIRSLKTALSGVVIHPRPEFYLLQCGIAGRGTLDPSVHVFSP